jgi:hypothetical protein
MSDLTEDEQENVRIALRVLRYRAGRWKLVAKGLGFTPDSIVNVTSGFRVASAKMAFRLARVVKMSVDDLLAGKFPPAGTCPKCGYCPDTSGAP